jgi:hypothetical protein
LPCFISQGSGGSQELARGRKGMDMQREVSSTSLHVYYDYSAFVILCIFLLVHQKRRLQLAPQLHLRVLYLVVGMITRTKEGDKQEVERFTENAYMLIRANACINPFVLVSV